MSKADQLAKQRVKRIAEATNQQRQLGLRDSDIDNFVASIMADAGWYRPEPRRRYKDVAPKKSAIAKVGDLVAHGSDILTESLVVEVNQNTIRVINTDSRRQLLRNSDVVENLGKCPNDLLPKYGQKNPESQELAGQYRTGAYVLFQDGIPLLIEIDKVGDDYFAHRVDQARVYIVNDMLWESLISTQAELDEEVELILQPGLYMTDCGHLVECVQANGVSYGRAVDSAELNEITAGDVVGLRRVESDYIDVSAAVFVPVNNPAKAPEEAENEPSEPSEPAVGCQD